MLAYLFDKAKSIKAKRRNTNFVNFISSEIYNDNVLKLKVFIIFPFLNKYNVDDYENQIDLAKGKFGYFVHKVKHIYFTRIAILSFGTWKRERMGMK